MSDVVVCVPWGEQHVASVKVRCRSCGKALAMSRVVRADLPTAVAECPPCAYEHAPEAQPQVTMGTRLEVMAELGFDPADIKLPSLGDFIRKGGLA